jgi:hypothetical protein
MKDSTRKLVRFVWPLVLFAIGMAFLESAVVVYLRDIWGIGDSLFPVMPILEAKDKTILTVEVAREAATLVMFIGLAYAVARTRVQWWAAVLITFGVWDIFYYVWLEVCLGWPASLGTWDVLFLLPVQMTGPVYAPASVAVLMTVGGVVFLCCENAGCRVRYDARFWGLFLGGLLLVLISFYTNGVPSTYDKAEAELVYWWPLLVVGDGLGIAAMFSATRELLSRVCERTSHAKPQR